MTFCQNTGRKMSSNSFVLSIKSVQSREVCKLNRTVSWARVLTKGWWDGRQENMDKMQIETVGGPTRGLRPRNVQVVNCTFINRNLFSCHMASKQWSVTNRHQHRPATSTGWPQCDPQPAFCSLAFEFSSVWKTGGWWCQRSIVIRFTGRKNNEERALKSIVSNVIKTKLTCYYFYSGSKFC